MRERMAGWVCAVMCAAAAAAGQEPAAAPAGETVVVRQVEAGLSESLRREANAAMERGVAWLKARQQPGGYWSNRLYPALTGLPVWALTRAGQGETDPVRAGVRYLLSCAREDGGIYCEPAEGERGGGLSNYNTAICMTALLLSGDPAAVPAVRKARRFVARSQHLGGDVYYGGMGYDAASGRTYADLSNSYIAYEAMRMTESVEDLRAGNEGRADLDWKAAERFVQSNQNDPRFNKQPWVTDDPGERGGFVYTPEQTRAGTFTDAAGRVKFRSMQGMTYAGLLSYIYADVNRSDPRVEATVNWVVRNWSLGGNRTTPGAPPGEKTTTADEREGLFYLYNVMAKGLAAYGQDVFTPPSGTPFNWRVQLVERLLALQKTEAETGHGYWVNEVGRYWESDPVLVTSYALIALEVAAGR